ncbi:hypothetical protein [Azohydromonas australica]|nr:hypothetical protein [Azohydromonas australica]
MKKKKPSRESARSLKQQEARCLLNKKSDGTQLGTGAAPDPGFD